MIQTSPQLLAVDLDGTLLNRSGEPHARDVRALRKALVAGVRVSILTGRLYSGTRAVAQHIGLHGPVGCADGSHLVQARDHATLAHFGVRGNDAHVLRRALARAEMTIFVFARDAIGHDARGATYLHYVSTWSTDIRVAANALEHEFWTTEDGVTAVVAMGPRANVVQAAEDLKRELPHSVVSATFPVRSLTENDTWAMLVRSAGQTKGTAIRWIAEREGIALKDTVCVGDWLNDIPMFEVAGRSFAMGQAPFEVRSKATDVLVETVEEGGGVARAVEEAFGIRVD